MPKISEILGAIFQKNIDLCHFWLFWAVLGPLGPIPGKPEFSGKIRLCQFSSFMVPKLHAKNQKNPWSRFLELLLLTDQQTDQQYQPELTSRR